MTELHNSRRLERYLLIIFLLTLPILNPWVRGDGVGYYAYARAPLIEHHFDFTRDYQRANDSFRVDRLDQTGMPKAIFYTRTGHLENHFTIGPALLWSPFLVTAHLGVLIARALGSSIPADGFSAPYRYAMALGTGIYGFLALLLSLRLTRNFVHPTWAFLATLAIWWGSSLPVYMYFNPSWSHAHSAFAVSLFLWYWLRTREHRSLTQWVILGLIVGLMLNVYYANLMIVSVLLVEALFQYRDAFHRANSSNGIEAPALSQLFVRHLLFGVVVCLTMLPTFLSRYIVYGGPFETGYLSVRDFLWHSPVMLQVLFSSDHGLFSWTPLLLLSFLGLIFFTWRVPRIGLPFMAALISFYLFFSFYPDWDGISSFGNRFFVSLTPFFIFGLAVTLERFAALFRTPRLATAAASVALSCFVLWNLGLIYQWGTHLVPARGPVSFRRAAYNQVAVVPRQLSSHVASYFLRRSELMRELEEEDREQQQRQVEDP
jgi:hypothetical protein